MSGPGVVLVVLPVGAEEVEVLGTSVEDVELSWS